MLADVPVLLAFTGGLVATVNPCGFAMLPAYLSFFLGVGAADAPAERAVGVSQALRVGVTVAAGFLVVFGAAWVLLAVGLRAIMTAVPWAALVVGVAVLGLGVWLLSGRPLPIRLPSPGRAVDGRSTGAVFVFGLGYAVASLSCTLPVFLAVVAGSVTRLSVASGLVAFGAYAVGMALPLLAVTVALAIGRDTLVRRARSLGRVVHRLGGALLLSAGLYIIAYWGTALAGVDGGPLARVIVAVERASAHVTMRIGEQPLLWGAVFALVVAVTVVLSRRARRRLPEREVVP